MTSKRGSPAGADSTNTVPPVPGALSDAAKQPYLIVIAGANMGELYKLSKQRVVIGRSAGADIRISDDGTSRLHLELVIERGAVLVRDLGSTNGTYVNGIRIDVVDIADGDKISLGGTTILKFSYQDGIDELYEQGLYRSAVRDGLTQALKREFWLERLEGEIAFAARHGALLALILLDLDRFKSVNDRFGHLAGDRVLQEVACTVTGVLRQEDVFGRYGGEEFGIVCRLTSPDQASHAAERLRVAIEQTVIDVEGLPLRITASFGVATYPGPAPWTVAGFIAAADAALLRAKAAGRNRVELARLPATTADENTPPGK